MSKTWETTLRDLKSAGIIPHSVFRVLLYGPPRTGKSTTAGNLFHAERATMFAGMSNDDLLGGYDPRSVGHPEVNAWQDGVAVRAMRAGTMWVADEVEQIAKAPAARFMFHALLDDPAAVTLPSGERVVAKPGYGCIGTTNAMPSTLPPPILDRFDLILPCMTLAEGLRQRLGNLADAAQRSVQECAQWLRPCSPNLLLTAAKMRGAGMKAEQIAAVLYPEQEREQADMVTLLTVASL